MDETLAQDAIDSALSCNWEIAVKLNSLILKKNSHDIEALNRIARAYAELGDNEKAKNATTKVLKLDPMDPIANRCLDKWRDYPKYNGNTHTRVSPGSFIEEPGRTKIINLINLGDLANISALPCGEALKLIPHMHRISVATIDDKYIG